MAKMTVKEIEMAIRIDKSRLKKLDDKIAMLKADKSATRNALAFWRGELKAAKESEKKHAKREG